MGHTIQIVSTGLTTVELNSGNIICGDFRWISDTTAELDLLIKDTTSALVQSHYNLIESRMEQAKRRRRSQWVTPVYLTVQWAGESTAWRSEVVEGEMLLVERSLDQLVSFKMECKLIVTHQMFWEEASETEIAVDTNATVGAVTGGASIDNHMDGTIGVGDGNIIDIASSAVEGVLPTPYRLVLTNTEGSTVTYNNIYISQAVGMNTAFLPVLEGEASEQGGGTIKGAENGSHTFSTSTTTLTDNTKSWTIDQWVGYTVRNVTDGSQGTITSNDGISIDVSLSGGTDRNWENGDLYVIRDETNYSAGYYNNYSWGSAIDGSILYSWTVPGTQLEYAAGRYFRVLARLASSPNATTYIKLAVYLYSATKVYETPEIKLSADLLIKDLGVIQLPPGLAGYSGLGDVKIRILGRDSAAGSLDIDFIQLMSLEGWRHLSFVGGSSMADGSFVVDDGIGGYSYVDDNGTDKNANVASRGDVPMLIPGQSQRFMVLFDETGSMNINRTNDVQIYYRPRRRTI